MNEHGDLTKFGDVFYVYDGLYLKSWCNAGEDFDRAMQLRDEFLGELG